MIYKINLRMKRIFITFFISVLVHICNAVCAQDPDGIYVIIKAQKAMEESQYNKDATRDIYNSSKGNYKNPIIIFSLPFDTNSRKWDLWHFYRIKPKPHETSVNPKDQHKVFLKDSSFLSTVDCLYWDDIKDLNPGEIEIYIGPLLFHKMPDGKMVKRTIYVVDLAEKHPANQIKIYQVQDMKGSGWFISTYSKEDAKQSWVQHEKAIREQIDQRREQRKEKSFKN